MTATHDLHPAGRAGTAAGYLQTWLRWWRLIVYAVVGVALVTAGITFLLPKWYRSTASLLPPKQPDIFGSMGGAGSVLRSLSSATRLGALGQRPSTYNYFALLKSRTASEAVIRKFDLINVYDVKKGSMEEAIKELSGNVAFEDQPDDYISVEVMDKDPQRAADMANYFVEVLNRLSAEVGTQEARNNRTFIEKRLDEARGQLAAAEDSLRLYQKRAGLMITPEQASTVSAIASLYAMKSRKEVEIAVLERSAPNDQTLTLARLELRELERKLNTFPDIGLASFRLYRDVAIQQKIVEFLVPLYEQARIDEQRDTPVLLVLDRAVPAEKKAKPQRLLIVLVVTTLAGMAMLALVLFFEGILRREEHGTPRMRRLAARVRRVAAATKVPPEPGGRPGAGE